jgi:rhomboid protease GluP
VKFGNISVGPAQRRAILSSMIFFVGVNLFLGAAIPGIDNMCHLGGLISGLIFGVPLATASASGKKSFEWATIVLAALVLAGIGAQVVKAREPVVQRMMHQSLIQQAQEDLRTGDYSHAIVLLEQATADNPDSPRLQALLGYAYEQNHERDKAISAYNRALQLDPTLPGVRKQLDNLQSTASPEK